MELLRILSSPRILDALLALKDGPKKRNELKNVLNVSTSHMVQILGKVTNLELVEQKGEHYCITPKGNLVLSVCELLKDYDRLMEKFSIMNEYSFDFLPDYLFERLHQLSEARIVEKKEDTFRPHEEFVNAVIEAKEVRGYTSIFFPEHVSLFSSVVDEKDYIGIIVNRDVMKEILANYREELKWGLKKENVGFYLSREDVKFSFIVTDRELLSFFYFKNGFFDYRRELICQSSECVEWGEELYRYILNNSVRVREEDVDKLALDLLG